MLELDYLKWILSIIGFQDSPEITSRFYEFTGEDWDQILRLALREHMASCLYYRLKQRGLDQDLPIFAKGKLRSDFTKTLARNTIRYNVLGLLLDKFNEADIPAIILKGGYLAEHVYDSIGMRPMSDFDLLINPSHATKAIQIMQDSGFSSVESDLSNMNFNKIRCIHFYTGHPKVKIDLHFNLNDSKSSVRIKMDEIWSRSQNTSINGVPVLTLSLEDHLIFMSFHAGYKHVLRGFRYLVDLIVLMSYAEKQIDWKKIDHTARNWGCEKVMYLTLEVLHILTGINNPVVRLQSRQEIKTTQKIAARLSKQICSDWCDEILVFSSLIYMFAQPTLRKKIKYFREAIIQKPQMTIISTTNIPNTQEAKHRIISRIIDRSKFYLPSLWLFVLHSNKTILYYKLKKLGLYR